MRMRFLFGALAFVPACTGIIDTGGPVLPPPPTDVQIAVREAALPMASAEVIFQAADGTVIADVMTDAAGHATAEMPDGGNLTVIRTYPAPLPPATPMPAEAYTYVGVKPGDRLVLVRPATDQTPSSAINILVSPDAGTVNISTPCGSAQGAAPAVPITIRGCMPDAFYVSANQTSFFARVPFSENIDLRMMTLRQMLSSSAVATNVTPGTTVTVEDRVELDGFLIYSSGAKRVDAAEAALDLPQADGVEQVIVTQITDGNGRIQAVAAHAPYASSVPSIDASAGLIASVSAKPTFSPTAITWMEASPGAPDFVISSLAVTRSGATDPSGKYVRTIIAPYTGMSLAMPALPGAAAIYNPAMGDQVDLSLALAKVSGGYDAIRAGAFTVSNLLDATPMNGQLTLSYTGTRHGF